MLAAPVAVRSCRQAGGRGSGQQLGHTTSMRCWRQPPRQAPPTAGLQTHPRAHVRPPHGGNQLGRKGQRPRHHGDAWVGSRRQQLPLAVAAAAVGAAPPPVRRLLSVQAQGVAGAGHHHAQHKHVGEKPAQQHGGVQAAPAWWPLRGRRGFVARRRRRRRRRRVGGTPGGSAAKQLRATCRAGADGVRKGVRARACGASRAESSGSRQRAAVRLPWCGVVLEGSVQGVTRLDQMAGGQRRRRPAHSAPAVLLATHRSFDCQ